MIVSDLAVDLLDDSTNDLRLPGSSFVRTVPVPVLLFVGGDALCQSISVDSQHDGGLREVLPVFREGLLDVEFLKLADRFIQKDVAIQHLVD
jgi:hypothetical protein